MSVQLQFVLGAGLSSRAIAWFSAGGHSGFSHVDAVLPDGTLLGARSDKIGGHGQGVWIRPPGYERWARVVRFSLPATEIQAHNYYQFLSQQIGKSYDKLAIFGFMMGRAWMETDTWICSELQAAALIAAGLCPKLYLAANQITPTTLALLVSALGGQEVRDEAQPWPRSV